MALEVTEITAEPMGRIEIQVWRGVACGAERRGFWFTTCREHAEQFADDALLRFELRGTACRVTGGYDGGDMASEIGDLRALCTHLGCAMLILPNWEASTDGEVAVFADLDCTAEVTGVEWETPADDDDDDDDYDL